MEERNDNSRRGQRDRLSALPDCLLHHIMSFLSTQEAVQTCILSKRWKDLWTTLPFLNFSLHEYHAIDDGVRSEQDKFREFVSTALLLREPSDLVKFQLHCYLDEYYTLCIVPWIIYALKHNPRVINITVFEWEAIPLNIFTCSSLEDVSLSFVYSEFPRRTINLPNLKRLYLHQVSLDEELLKNLFCNCPLLQNLHLANCRLEVSTIKSQNLKYLAVESSCESLAKTLHLIDAPNLLSFYYSCCPNYIGHKILLNMPSLTDATIFFCECSECNWRSYEGESINFFHISNVQNLKLMGRMVKDILTIEPLRYPMFPNMKDLFVDILCLNCHFDLLVSLLDHVPNLKRLSLGHHGHKCEKYKEHGNQELLKVAQFPCTQLKAVEVRFCSSDMHFAPVMKYLWDGVGKLRARVNMSTFP